MEFAIPAEGWEKTARANDSFQKERSFFMLENIWFIAAALPRCDLGIVLIDASAGLTQDDLGEWDGVEDVSAISSR
jgi:hypothetical protein